ncbi:heavy metal translocating P-type ATPase [Pollutibacter soli]|uniref:heavy metal translocating P-type ATPase n=1 Tax=Pollutibacter soli TaxID=3034157 RepID=UPI0030137086
MEKVKINLDVLLPDVPDEKDACVKRIIDELEGRQGIDRVHIVPASDSNKAQLCLHFRPDIISLDRVKKLAEQEGVKITSRYHHILAEVDGIRHQRQTRAVETILQQKKGIQSASVSGSGFVSIEYDTELITEPELYKLLSDEDLAVKNKPAFQKQKHDHSKVLKHEHDHDHDHDHSHAHGKNGHDHAKDHDGIFGKKTELILSIICGAALAIGFGLSFVDGISQWVPLGFYIVSYFFGGFYTAKEAVVTISRGGFEIDFLMLVAAIGAAILGNWAEGALLLFLFSLSHALEHFAMEKARKSIAALTELAPRTALLKQNGEIKEISISELRINDVIVVKPNTKVAADGIVIDGASSVNQAPITGESIPVDKIAVSDAIMNISAEKLDEQYRVFSGTINGNGSLDIKVTREASDSTLARLIKLVNEAQTQKSPTQQFTDKFEKYFVPVVLILVCLLCLAFLVIDEPFGSSFYRAMSVLVAASPCALAISTPSAVLSGVARAARAGVLVKGGKPLEDLGSISTLAFDKTGTLTEGKPKLTGIVSLDGIPENEILKTIVAVEALSDHPIAKAIVRDGKVKLGNEEIPVAEDMEAVLGKGLKARLGSDQIYVGNLRLFETLDDSRPTDMVKTEVAKLEEAGNTTMVIRRNSSYVGIIAVMDTPRPEAKKVLEELKEIGIKKMVMLTGDNQKVADAVAKQTGITKAIGSLLPEQKLEAIKKLTQQDNKVAMVGDGVNDAPAMAKSTVGIAMGAAGSDVALETADIALMGDKLSLLPFAIGLSRKAKRIIKQNVFISLGMVTVLVPLTISGIASIGPAVLAHEGSTLVVVFNALRLLGYKKSS